MQDMQIVVSRHGRKRFRQRVGHSAVEKTLQSALHKGTVLLNTSSELKVFFNTFLFLFARCSGEKKILLKTVEKESESLWAKYHHGEIIKKSSRKRFLVAL